MLNLAKLVIVAGVALLSLVPAKADDSIPLHFLSGVSNNSTLVYKPTGGQGVRLNGGVAVNTTATAYYLKFYNKATAPTCGTDPVVWTIPLPANGIAIPLPDTSAIFSAGLGFCIVANLVDTDNTNAAVGIAVNLAISGR
jgi:hypothetical protein